MTEVIKKKSDAWLIVIALSNVIAWPLPALLGLYWSRRLHPLSSFGKFGYCLLWLSITLIPFSLAYFMATYSPMLLDRVWQLGLYIVFISIWFCILKYFIKTPSQSVGKAFFISIIGALLVAPSLTIQMLFLPSILGNTINFIEWISLGATIKFLPILLGFPIIMGLPIFLAHIIVQWPEKKETN